jgi:hypothetical protein
MNKYRIVKYPNMDEFSYEETPFIYKIQRKVFGFWWTTATTYWLDVAEDWISDSEKFSNHIQTQPEIINEKEI